MITLLRREFVVELPPEKAWEHLARVEEWPSWAKHIRQVRVQPPGALGPNSTGFLQLCNGLKPAFTVTEFNPTRNWKWVGAFLWLTVHYDHHFEEQSPTQTKLTWFIDANGFSASIIGRLFAMIYKRDLDRAIPMLIQEMNASPV
jgi:Polyketide cyclase / dehydrase and lipid transport